MFKIWATSTICCFMKHLPFRFVLLSYSDLPNKRACSLNIFHIFEGHFLCFFIKLYPYVLSYSCFRGCSFIRQVRVGWQIVENPLLKNYFTEADIQIWGIYAWLEQRYFGGCQSVENQLSVQISVMMSHVLLRLWE